MLSLCNTLGSLLSISLILSDFVAVYISFSTYSFLSKRLSTNETIPKVPEPNNAFFFKKVFHSACWTDPTLIWSNLSIFGIYFEIYSVKNKFSSIFDEDMSYETLNSSSVFPF